MKSKRDNGEKWKRGTIEIRFSKSCDDIYMKMVFLIERIYFLRKWCLMRSCNKKTYSLFSWLFPLRSNVTSISLRLTFSMANVQKSGALVSPVQSFIARTREDASTESNHPHFLQMWEESFTLTLFSKELPLCETVYCVGVFLDTLNLPSSTVNRYLSS